MFIATPSYGQKKYTVKSRKAIRFYETAAQHYRNRDNNQALFELEKAIKQSPNFIEAWLFKADVFKEMENTKGEIEACKKAMAIDTVFFPNVHFNLANAYLKIGKYTKAKQKYYDFLSFPNISKRNKRLAEKRVKNCKFAISMIENPVDFQPVNLGDSVNSEYDEYWPSLTADEEVLIFTRLAPGNKEDKLKRQEDFWMSQKAEHSWKSAQALSNSINTPKNEGAQSITADGQYMYFTACDRADGMGRCDIYCSVRQGGKWSGPVNLGKPVNTSAWEAQPGISADGRILYFVSNRKSGKGKMDIWQSRLLEITWDGKQRWSKPVNLPLNSPNNEMSPFIHAGNEYLVFSSDGREGMGGFDLYKITKSDNNEWDEPVNLGYPINTFGDEMGLIINARGDKAYFSSNRIEEKGKDIFSFDLPEEHQPPAASWLKGKVYDAENKKPLFASLLLVDLASKDTIAQINSDKINGNYLVCLPAGREYLFAAEAPGCLFYSDHFSMLNNQKKSSPQKKDITLHKIKKGSEIVLKNVFYETDSWEILPQSEIELDHLAYLLKKQTNLVIEIGGHTDNTGSAEHNLKLSENRAKAVCSYLISKGISQSRLNYRGYGANKPIADNSTEQGKSQNRRTEFQIIETEHAP